LKKFSELDNILLGLDAAEYIPLFNKVPGAETFLNHKKIKLKCLFQTFTQSKNNFLVLNYFYIFYNSE